MSSRSNRCFNINTLDNPDNESFKSIEREVEDKWELVYQRDVEKEQGEKNAFHQMKKIDEFEVKKKYEEWGRMKSEDKLVFDETQNSTFVKI